MLQIQEPFHGNGHNLPEFVYNISKAIAQLNEAKGLFQKSLAFQILAWHIVTAKNNKLYAMHYVFLVFQETMIIR